MNSPANRTRKAVDDEPPPFGTWPMWYGGVLTLLAVLIIVFYIFTESYR